MQEDKIIKRIPTNLITKTIITSSAEYESNKEYTDEDANIYEKHLQAITNVSIDINNDIEKIKALEDNILEQYNKNVELANKMKQETEKFAKQANTAIEDYNSNAETKTEEFNTNAEEKIADYNEHVETFTSRIADLEEETEDLFNALDTEKASGTELYIDDAKACRVINTGIGGMYKQTTTTGKNKLDISKMYPIQNSKDRIDIDINKTDLKITVKSDGTWRVGVININNLTIGNTYLVSFSKFTNSSSTDAIIGIYKSDGSYIKSVTLKNSNSLSFSATEETIELRIGYSSSCTKGDILVVSDLMLEVGTTATDYEPYTGRSSITKSQLSAGN